MKNSILNLEGVQELSRNEQKNVNGGLAINRNCRLTITENGQTYSWPFYSSGNTGEAVSAGANAECVSIIQDGATRCKYDCAYDN
jgi:hypothetical protein